MLRERRVVRHRLVAREDAPAEEAVPVRVGGELIVAVLIAVPNALVEPTVRQLEGKFFTGARVESVRAVSNANERTWAVNVVKK